MNTVVVFLIGVVIGGLVVLILSMMLDSLPERFAISTIYRKGYSAGWDAHDKVNHV